MTTPNNLLARGAAETGIAAGRSRNYQIPDDLTAAIDQLAALDKIIAAPYLPTGSLPADPSQIEPWLREQAAASRAHTDTIAEAEPWRGHAIARMIGLYRSILPTWLDLLAAEFNTTFTTFTDAATIAPATLNASAGDDQVAAFMACERAAVALDRAVWARTTFGASIAEEGAGGLLAVVDLPALPASVPELNETWPRLSEQLGNMRLPTGTAGWRGLHALDLLTVRMAGSSGLRQRANLLDAWRSWAMEVNATAGGSRRYEAAMTIRPADRGTTRVAAR